MRGPVGRVWGGEWVGWGFLTNRDFTYFRTGIDRYKCLITLCTTFFKDYPNSQIFWQNYVTCDICHVRHTHFEALFSPKCVLYYNIFKMDLLSDVHLIK